MTILKNMGFETVLEEKAWSYPSDGVVYRVNSHHQSNQLGYTAKYPRFAVALKERELETVITSLQDVEWNIGRTGTVNPTAIITPVVIDGATISRLTLHNLGIIEEHNLGLGDLIEIERAGGVIPKFLRVVEYSKHNIKITKDHAEKAIGCKTIREGPKLVLIDKTAVNNTKNLEHFIKVMDIKGLGLASINKLSLENPKDIYSNVDWSILGANGAKIEEEIDRSKKKPYEQVLAALGIPGVGKVAATAIVQKIPAFRNLREIETADIKGIGPATKRSIITWLELNEDWVLDLPLQLEKALHIEDVLQTKSTKKVCITGKMDMTRNQLSEILANNGFIVTSGVSKDCYALISGGDSTSSKYKKAVELGVQVIDYWSYRTNVVNGNF